MLDGAIAVPSRGRLASMRAAAPAGDLPAARDPRQLVRWAILGLSGVTIPMVLLTAGAHLGPGIRYTDVLALCAALGGFALIALAIPWQRLEEHWLLVLVGGPIVFTAALNSLTGAGVSPYLAIYAPLLAIAGWYLSPRLALLAVGLVVGTELWRAAVLDRSGSIEYLAIALPLAVVIAGTASLTARWLRNALVETRHEQLRLAATLDAVRALGADLEASVLDQLQQAAARLFDAHVTVLRFDAAAPPDLRLAPALVDGRRAVVMVKGASQIHALVRLESRGRLSAQDIRLAAILAEAAGRTIDAQELLRRTRADVERDALTGLLNRRAFDRELALAFHDGRQAPDVALLFVDLDAFKLLNDSHGHAVGDAVLVRLASILRGSARRGDGVYRYGGDEFAVLLRNAGQRQAERLARRISRRVAESGARPEDEGIPPFSVSIGSAVPAVGWTAEDLLKAADEAMYQMKRDAGVATTVGRVAG